MIPMLRSTSALIGRGEQIAELAPRLLHEHPFVFVVGPLESARPRWRFSFWRASTAPATSRLSRGCRSPAPPTSGRCSSGPRALSGASHRRARRRGSPPPCGGCWPPRRTRSSGMTRSRRISTRCRRWCARSAAGRRLPPAARLRARRSPASSCRCSSCRRSAPPRAGASFIASSASAICRSPRRWSGAPREIRW